MKRGFLNKAAGNLTSNKLPSPATCSGTPESKSKLTESAAVVATVPLVPPKGIVRIPTGPIKLFLEPTPTDNVLANWPQLQAGIVITTLPPPQIQDVYTVCLFPYGIKEKILDIENFPGPVDFSLTMYYKIRIGPVPGAGNGLFAQADFKVGDLILTERPLLLIPAELPFVKLKGNPHPDKMLEQMINTMDIFTRALFMKLHNCKGSDRPKIRGIMDTNGLGLGAMPGHDAQYLGVFDQMSRINHRSVTETSLCGCI
jgi:hypothetical protein